MPRDWHAWYGEYDDPASSLTRRLAVVREQLARVLEGRRDEHTRLLSLCSGDGRDTVPVLADLPEGQRERTTAVLVELDPELAQAAREASAAAALHVDVRTGDAGAGATWADACPADVLLLCGIFGNIRDDDIRTTVAALPSLLGAGGTVIWTRGHAVPQDPTEVDGDPAEWVRRLMTEAGLEEVAFVKPPDAGFRVGVHRWGQPTSGAVPARLFAFV